VELLIEIGSLWEFPEGTHRFCSERPNDVLLFQKERTAADKFVTRDEFVSLHGRGKVFEINFFKTRTASGEQVQPANFNDEFGPDEEGSPEIVRAQTLQFYVRKWDADGTIGLGRRALAVFIHRWRPEAIQRGHLHDVKPARLYEAIRRCGEVGNRPLRLFRSRRGKGTRKRLNDFVLKALDAAVIEYWSDRTWDYKDAYAHFRGLMRRENERRHLAELPILPFPKKMESLRRRINAATNHANWARKYSKLEADRKFKGVHPGLKADKPLELVIMDHTVVDTWTVLDTTTGIPFKQRACLTVAIDVATRMPLGHLVSFEPASLYSVLTTLRRVNKNKDYIAKVFGDIEGKWDGWGHPEAILVDNGLEFTSPSFQDALADIGTEIIWAPVRTPEYKAIGERFFRTLNTMLFHKLEGSVPYDPKTMSQLGLKPSENAVISLGALDRLIHHAIIVYQNEFNEGLGAIPARIWDEKINRHGRRFIPDTRQLGAMLGRVGIGKLTRRGVKFENMVFHEPAATTRLLEDLLRLEAKRTQSTKPISSARIRVKFKWNPADASKIEVWNHGAEIKHYVALSNVSQRFTDHLSFWQAAKVREYALEKDFRFQTDEEQWQARERLRREYDALAGKRLGDSRDARRGIAQTMGTYEEADVEPKPTVVRNQDVLDSTTKPSVDGYAEATLVPTDPPAFDRIDDTEPPAGFAPSKESLARAKKTRARKKAEHEAKDREAAAKAAAEEERQRIPLTGNDLTASPDRSYGEQLRKRQNWTWNTKR
jgi:putative transposase